MGRPSKNDTDKRIHQVNIRFTDGEHIRINLHATESGLTPANWIRHKVFTGKFPPARLSAIDRDTYHELKKIGVNLNQIAKKINQGEKDKIAGIIISYEMELRILLNKILKLLTDDRQHDQG